jgi:AGZA family xanthine/uracil permease-like MFS transporter
LISNTNSLTDAFSIFFGNADIGHPAHKRSGAKTGYSMANGLIYFIMSWFGILAFIQSIVNVATIGPIVLFVGTSIWELAIVFGR